MRVTLFFLDYFTTHLTFLVIQSASDESLSFSPLDSSLCSE